MQRRLLAVWIVALIACKESSSGGEDIADGGSDGDGGNSDGDGGGDSEEERRLREEQVVAALHACQLFSEDGVYAGGTRDFQEVCTAKCLLSASCTELRGYWCGRGQTGNLLNRCLRACDAEYSSCETTLHNVPRCDGNMDCPDGSDERDCRYFVCKSGQRIPALRRCDVKVECADSSDEEGCGFACSDGEVTEDPFSRCNGEAECADESDERDCASFAFACEDGRGAVARWMVCDAVPQCEDGSDEMQGCARKLCD